MYKKHTEEKLDHRYFPAITNRYNPIYKKHSFELVDQPNNQPNRKFLRNGLPLKVIMDHRTDESCDLKRNLGFNLHDVINDK